MKLSRDFLIYSAASAALLTGSIVYGATEPSSASSTSPSASSSTTSSQQYADMTTQDCAALPSKRSQYSTTEYRNRMEFCRSQEQTTSSNTPTSGSSMSGSASKTSSNSASRSGDNSTSSRW